jgi:hypothetical protein
MNKTQEERKYEDKKELEDEKRQAEPQKKRKQ